MALDAQSRRILDSYQLQTDDLSRRVEAFVAAVWDSLTSHRDDDIARFVATVAPVLEGAQASMSGLTVAYMDAFGEAFAGVRATPVTVDVTSMALRGVPAQQALQRAGTGLWYDLSRDVPYEAAVQAGRRRAISVSLTNIQLAKTHTSRAVAESTDEIVGYRRVLKGAYDCAKCVVASTQRYRKSRLMPIHPGCNCDVSPIYGGRDPGRIIDPDTLENIHERIAQEFGESSDGARGIPRSAAEYRDVLVVNDHGEIGPILGVRGQNFTGPNDI